MEAFQQKVWLSSPMMHGDELKYMTEAYTTNWMSTVGENLNKIEDQLAEEILTNAYQPGDTILLKLEDDKIVFERKAGDAKPEGKKEETSQEA